MLVLLTVFAVYISYFLILILILLKFLEYLLPLIFRGGIYVPTKMDKIKKMVDFLEVRPGEKAVDLGSGDGRLVIALAKAGAEAYGYEINPFLVTLARKNIKKAGLEGRAFVYQKNFWKEDLSKFDIIVIYGIFHIMKRLGDKLKNNMKENARVASNAFSFPLWKHVEERDGVYLYKKNGRN